MKISQIYLIYTLCKTYALATGMDAHNYTSHMHGYAQLHKSHAWIFTTTQVTCMDAHNYTSHMHGCTQLHKSQAWMCTTWHTLAMWQPQIFVAHSISDSSKILLLSVCQVPPRGETSVFAFCPAPVYAHICITRKYVPKNRQIVWNHVKIFLNNKQICWHVKLTSKHMHTYESHVSMYEKIHK
jgi:hypothetical protein